VVQLTTIYLSTGRNCFFFFFFFFNRHCNPCEYSQQEGFYRLPLPASRPASNLEDQWLERCHPPHPASESQQRRVELWARKGREFCRKWRLPRHFSVLLHAVNLRHGTDGFTSPPMEGALRIFSPEKSDGFGRVWTREARSSLDHRSP